MTLFWSTHPDLLQLPRVSAGESKMLSICIEHNADRQAKRQRFADMSAFHKEQTGEITEYDDKLVRQLVEQV